MAYSLAFSQAIAILLYICINNQEKKSEYLSTKLISDYLNIPFPTAAKVLKSMSAAGIIATKEGAGGGIMLSRNPGEITLLDIFVAIERERPLFKMRLEIDDDRGKEVLLKEKIQIPLNDAEQSMKESLRKITLKNLLQN